MAESKPIYKIDSQGRLRTWQYVVEDNKWCTIAGLVDGQKVQSEWTVCDRAKSQDTPEDQALFEAQAEERKKLDRDYHETIEGTATPNFFKPMLAKKYESWLGSCFSQPKFDGVRCIATPKGLFSREGKRFFSVPHIEEALAEFFEEHPFAILDGELYNHDLRSDFEKIISLVRKQKPTDEDLAASRSVIHFYCYDVASTVTDSKNGMNFVERMFFLNSHLPTESGVIVDVQYDPIDTENQLDEAYGSYLAQGYEGQMVRFNKPYEQKRSKFLLKRKEFEDGEFDIVDIESGLGNWAGYGKKIKFRLPDGRIVGAGVKGSQSFTRSLLERRLYWIGKKATIRYFTPTADGIPRFPVAVAFHDEDQRL